MNKKTIMLICGLGLTFMGVGANYQPEKWNFEARQKFAEQRFRIF